MAERKLYPYPLTVIMDRYSGMSSGGRFTAWNMDPEDIPRCVYGGDFEAISFWEDYYEDYKDTRFRAWIIGVGNTPEEAIDDLISKQKEQGVFVGV